MPPDSNGISVGNLPARPLTHVFGVEDVSGSRSAGLQTVEGFVAHLLGLAGLEPSGLTELSERLTKAVADLQGSTGSLYDLVTPGGAFIGATARSFGDGRNHGWTIAAGATGAGTAIDWPIIVSRGEAAHLAGRPYRITLAFSTTDDYAGAAIVPGLNIESVAGVVSNWPITGVSNVQIAKNRRVISFTAQLPNALDQIAAIRPYVAAAGPATGAERWILLTGLYSTIPQTISDEINLAGEIEEIAFRRAVDAARPDAGELLSDTTRSGQVFAGASYRLDTAGNVIGWTIPAGSTGQATFLQANLPLPPDERALLAGTTVAIDFTLFCSANYALPFATGFLLGGASFNMSANRQTSANQRVVTFEGTIPPGLAVLAPFLQNTNSSAVAAEAWIEVQDIAVRAVKTANRTRTATQIIGQWASLRQARKTRALAVMAAADPLDAQVYARTTTVTSAATNLTTAAQALSGGSLVSRAALILAAGLWAEPGVFPPPFADIIGAGADLTTIDGGQPDNTALADVSGKSGVEFYWDGRLSGLTITTRNGRYGVHRDNPTKPQNLTGDIADCRITHLGNDGARTYQTSIGQPASAVWSAENGIGIGVNSGERLTIRRNIITAPNAPIGAHNINAQEAKAILRIEHNTLASTKGGAAELASLGSGKGDVAVFVGNTMPARLLMVCQPWLPTGLAYQPADHTEWEVSGHGNTPCAFEIVDFGRALKIESASTAATSAIVLGGSALAAIVGAPTNRPGSGGIRGYAYGYHDVSGTVAGTGLGARLGDCRTTSKALTVRIDGGATTTVTFNQDHRAQSNATVLGIINAALGSAATASLYAVGERYRPRMTDEERGLVNVSTAGIRMGQACAYADDGLRTIRPMTDADPADLFAGMAWEDIYPGTVGRVKSGGAIGLADFQMGGLTGALSFGALIGVGATPGSWATASAIPLLRASSGTAAVFLSASASNAPQAYTATADMPKHTNVVDLGGGQCAIADPGNMAHRGKLAGLTLAPVARGGRVVVLEAGPVTGFSGSLPLDADLFISDGMAGVPLGGLTDTPPSTGWEQNLGRMTGLSSLAYQPSEPRIILDDDDAILLPDGSGFASKSTDSDLASLSDKSWVSPADIPDALPFALDTLPLLPFDPANYPPVGGLFREGDANGYRVVRLAPGARVPPAVPGVPALIDAIRDLQDRFPKPQAFGIVFDAFLNSDGVTLQPGYTDNTLAINVYHLACKNAGVEPRYPRLPKNRGAFCSGQFWYYGPGDYSGTQIFAPVSASQSAQIALSADRISADRKTVTVFNQSPGKTYRLYVDGSNTGVTAVSDISGAVVFSYPAGVPVGASVSYTSATVKTWVVPPDEADTGLIDISEVKKLGGAVKGGTRVLGLVNRQGQCITFDTGDQILLGRGGARGTPTVTVGDPATFTANNHGLTNGRILTMAVDPGNSLPGGFTSKTYYYVINATLHTYQLALRPGGLGVAATTTGNGVMTSAPEIFRAGGVFLVNTPKGDISTGHLLDWETTTDGREFTVTISAGSPAILTKNNHGLVNGDLVLLSTTGTLPDPPAGQSGLRNDTYFFVVNATLDTFQLSTSYGGTAINSTNVGTGTHTVKAPIIAWNSGTFKWQRPRERIEIVPHPVKLVGPVGSPRERIGEVTRCNTTIKGWRFEGIPEGLTMIGLAIAGCTGSGAVDCSIVDLGVDATNYGIQVGGAAHWFIDNLQTSNVRRSIDCQRGTSGTVNGGSMSDGVGAHHVQGLKMFGGEISTANGQNPQLLQFTGGDLAFHNITGHMYSPCINYFNMRPDYMSLGGTVVHSGLTLYIDLDSYRENSEIGIFDAFGPATANDSLVDTEFPQSIVFDSSCNFIVKGKKLNRTIYLFRIGKNFGPIMQRRQKAPLEVKFEGTWDIEDKTERATPLIRALYTNTEQMYGPGPNITIRNVPDIFLELTPSSTQFATKVEGRPNVFIDCPTGKVRVTANQGGFKSVKIRANPSNVALTMDRTFPNGDEGSTIIDASTERVVDNVWSLGDPNGNNEFITPRDKDTLKINGASATVYNNSTIKFPSNPSVGWKFIIQTANNMNNNVYDGQGVTIIGSPPVNLTAGQTIVFYAYRNRNLDLRWVYEKQV